jgi:hypothetical protein
MEDKPTELTIEDLDKFLQYLENFEISMRKCFTCSKDFLANYSLEECDECYFSRFPKDQVEEFCRGFF